MKNGRLRRLTLSAVFLALGFILPFFTGQLPQIGNMLLPMHYPVLLCGFICGWRHGLTLGLFLPILRSLLFGAPPLMPIALAMSAELAAYGFISGFLYEHFLTRSALGLYGHLLAAMLGGRLMWGAAMLLLMGINAQAFTLKMFVAGAFVLALPGAALQLVIIPAAVYAYKSVSARYQYHLVSDQMTRELSDSP